MTRFGVLAVSAGALLLGSCTKEAGLTVPTIFVNATETAVVIRFETLRPTGEDGRRILCEHVRQPPQTTSEVVSGWNWDDARWAPAAGVEFDRDTCTTELRVVARSSAWIHTNGMCDDYGQYLSRNLKVRPSFESFQVLSPAQPVLLKDWDTARAFKRRFDACVYHFD